MDIEHFANWNPWWKNGRVPEELKGVERDIDSFIFKALNEREILVLTGIRRCGKTTIMYQMISRLLKKINPEQILYLNFDDELLKKYSLEEIYNFYRQQKNPDKKCYVFFDEIQNVEMWEKFLKKYYDMHKNIKFVVSGSSASLLKKEYSTLLTGRNLTFNIFPLSFKEYLHFSNIKTNSIDTAQKNKILNKLNEFLKYGGFPEVFFKDEEIKKILLKEYFDDIIYKDIVSRHNINAKKITDLAFYLITNVSNFFTIRKIRGVTGLSIDSIRDYISYLEDSFLIKAMGFFSYSLKVQSQLPRKSYCIDNGVRNAVSFKFSRDYGRLAENLVYSELERRGKEIYYWKEKGEVDFVVKNPDNCLNAINVSYSDEINEREVASLVEFGKKFKKCIRRVILTKDIEKTENGIEFIPLWKWLLM